MKIYEYTANFVIPNSIPPAGYDLYWQNCCRIPSILNLAGSSGKGFDLRVKMLPGAVNSARFIYPLNIAGISGKNQYFNHSAYDPDVQDSIYTNLANLKENSGGVALNIAYDSAYSKTRPFGLNVPTTFDSYTGLLQVDSVPQGIYSVAFRVRSYTNGVLTSVVRKDVPFYFDPLGDVPNLALSNLQGATVISAANNSYILEMKEMDSLSFDLTGTTAQLTLGAPSDITLLGYGTLLDTNSSKVGNCTGSNCASFSSASGSLVGAGSIQAFFSFKPDTSFVPSGQMQSNNMLSFNAYVEDSCGVNRLSSIVVKIVVKKVGAIFGPSTLSSCYSQGVYSLISGDTSNIIWSPTTGVSNPTSGMPLLNPSSSTLYTITHVPTGDTIQLMVNVDSIGPLSFNLINTGAELIVPSYSSSLVKWFYNGALLPVLSDTLPLILTGTYWAEINKGSCTAYSDSVHAIVTAKMSNSNNQGGTATTNATSSAFQFSLNQYANALENLELIFPDSSSGKTTSLVTVELLQAGNSIKTVVATQQSDWLWLASGFSTMLNPGMLYEIKVTTDFAKTVLFEPSVLPFTEDNGVVYIASGYYMENGTQIQGAYPYVNFKFSSAIGIGENELEVELYPNPAKDYIELSVNGTAELEIWDVQGKKVIVQEVIGHQSINIAHLVSGLYVYRITGVHGTSAGKLIKE